MSDVFAPPRHLPAGEHKPGWAVAYLLLAAALVIALSAAIFAVVTAHRHERFDAVLRPYEVGGFGIDGLTPGSTYYFDLGLGVMHPGEQQLSIDSIRPVVESVNTRVRTRILTCSRQSTMLQLDASTTLNRVCAASAPWRPGIALLGSSIPNPDGLTLVVAVTPLITGRVHVKGAVVGLSVGPLYFTEHAGMDLRLGVQGAGG